MIIDSSAVLAVLLGEEDAPFFANAIEQAADPQMSAVSALEAALVMERVNARRDSRCSIDSWKRAASK